MTKRRKETQQQRIIDKLYRDIIFWDKESYIRFIRSGFSHEEALEYLRITQMG